MRVKLHFSGEISKESLQVFGISLIAAFVSVNYLVHTTALQKAVWVMMAALGLFSLFCLKRKQKNMSVISILLVMIVPFIIVTLYTVVLVTIKGDTFHVRSQSVSTCLFMLVDSLMLFALYMIFRKRMIDILFYMVVLAFFINLLTIFAKRGIPYFFQYLTNSSIYPDWYFAPFEMHDVGVAVVPLIIYYSYMTMKEKTYPQGKLYVRIVALLVVLLLCKKRSAFLALAVGIVLLILLLFRKKNHPLIVGAVLIITNLFPFGYVYAIKTGLVESMFNQFGINSMGRMEVWKHFDDYYTLSPLYEGQGFQFVHCYMSQGMGNKLVNDFAYLHNSILQIYIECGFLLFFVWFAVISVVGYLVVKSVSTRKTAYFYLILTCSMISAFMVDNVLTYPLYQICQYGVLICFLDVNGDECINKLGKMRIKL